MPRTGRPPSKDPKPATLRQRKARGKSDDIGEARDDEATPAVVRLAAPSGRALVGAPREKPRLVAVTVYVPPADVNATLIFAERMRRIAKVAESEVPK